MTIEKKKQSLLFVDDKKTIVFPMRKMIFIGNEDSDLITVRLIGSRKNVHAFNYKDVTNIEAESANDFIEKITKL